MDIGYGTIFKEMNCETQKTLNKTIFIHSCARNFYFSWESVYFFLLKRQLVFSPFVNTLLTKTFSSVYLPSRQGL